MDFGLGWAPYVGGGTGAAGEIGMSFSAIINSAFLSSTSFLTPLQKLRKQFDTLSKGHLKNKLLTKIFFSAIYS